MDSPYVIFNATRIDHLTLKNLDDYLQAYPQKTIVINFHNSVPLTKDNLALLPQNNPRVNIRIAGQYDSEYINNHQRNLNSVKYDTIYTVNETIKIIREINKIEAGLLPNWSAEQKLLYFISVLRNKIMYHPRHETQKSKDIRSLRGLYSHKTVCAGYALILKELCDRNGIDCDYVVGSTKEEDHQKDWTTHAWNIVNIKGHHFPIDLTWNAGNYQKKDNKAIDDLFDAHEFIKSHFPYSTEKIQDYEHNLSSLSSEYVAKILRTFNKNKDFAINIFNYKRSDNTTFQITQVGNKEFGKQMVYRYIYADVATDGKVGAPIILYSGTSIAQYFALVNRKQQLLIQLQTAKDNNDLAVIQEITEKLKGSEYLTQEYCDLICDSLLSTNNIKAAIKRNDLYLGKVEPTSDANKKARLVIDQDLCNKMKFREKSFTRSDGSRFILVEVSSPQLNNARMYSYDIYEYLKEDNMNIVRQNQIYTDADLLNDNRQTLTDDFLSRERIDRKLREAGGYLGYYSKNNIRTYDPDKQKLFDLSKRKEFTLADIIPASKARDVVPPVPTLTPIPTPTPTPTPKSTPTPTPTITPTPVTNQATLVDLYRLKRDQIIQDIELNDLSDQNFQTPGMTDEEIAAAKANINEFGIIGSSIHH